MSTLWQDLRYGMRVLLKQRGFTLVAALALALGIGANTAIFSVVNAVLLRPLPFPEPGRLLVVWTDHRARGGPEVEWASPEEFEDWRGQNSVFERMAGYTGWGPTLTGQGEPEQLSGAAVSADMFPLFGVEPALGRGFLPEEDRRGAERVVVLGHGLWQRRFGADPGVIGRVITLGGEGHTVVGVMPAGFKSPLQPRAELWRTLRPALGPGCGRGCIVLRVVARLRPGVPLERARAEMSTIARRLEAQYPDSQKGVGVALVPLHDQLVRGVRPALLVLLVTVGLVLLISCANVASLTLAQATARAREVAVRLALGAGRGRVARQLLTESLLLALVGAAAGLLLAFWMVDLLKAFSPPGTPRLDEVRIDARVLGFTLVIGLVTGLVFGLVPALQTSKPHLNQALKEGGKGTSAGARSRRLRQTIVVAEVALALTLLVGAGLLLKSFVRLQRVDPGFNSRGILTATIGLPRTGYPERRQITAFYGQLIERLKALPGVQAAGAVSDLPLGGGASDVSFVVQGRPLPPPGQRPAAWYNSVTTDYFRTMGVRLLRGREFGERDSEQAPRAVIISETMARRFFPDEDPIGKRLGNGEDDNWREIVGVVADVRHFGLDAEARPTMYFPDRQAPSRGMSLVVRAGGGDPLALAGAVRGAVLALDPNLAVAGLGTLDALVSDSIATPRFVLLLIGAFAGVALLLAAVGIYGVMAYAVGERTHEIGVRMALGAQPGDVLRLVVGQGMTLVVAGVGLGLVGAFALTRLMATLLFQVSATDPLIFASVPAVLAGVALLACYLPARRATRVDPLVALRYE